MDLAGFEREIRRMASSGKKLLIGIDGESFAGKTMLAKHLCEAFSGWKRISLDAYISEPKVRIDAFRTAAGRKMLPERWYDQKRLDEVALPADSSVVVEGTFLLAALPPERFDAIFLLTRPDIEEKRVAGLRRQNILLSEEEARALDGAYGEAWQAYKAGFYRDFAFFEIDGILDMQGKK